MMEVHGLCRSLENEARGCDGKNHRCVGTRSIKDPLVSKTKGAPKQCKHKGLGKRRKCTSCKKTRHTKRNCPENRKSSLANYFVDMGADMSETYHVKPHFAKAEDIANTVFCDNEHERNVTWPDGTCLSQASEPLGKLQQEDFDANNCEWLYKERGVMAQRQPKLLDSAFFMDGPTVVAAEISLVLLSFFFVLL
ncbi:hypothetical protein PIB30_060043 [Stylosanthes scabra]|uniref:Uncharacterized protein n=1 Tax=Stylosanthes scabra TaxID=79078 RepID=A0ABU6WM39_9FABA|nr:hypothetical protein [Stylosanthes scabra]